MRYPPLHIDFSNTFSILRMVDIANPCDWRAPANSPNDIQLVSNLTGVRTKHCILENATNASAANIRVEPALTIPKVCVQFPRPAGVRLHSAGFEKLGEAPAINMTAAYLAIRSTILIILGLDFLAVIPEKGTILVRVVARMSRADSHLGFRFLKG